MFQTHTHKIGLLAIIYSFFLSFWSVYVKYVSDAKVQKFRLARFARSIYFMGFSQVSCFLVCIMNKTISRVLRTQGHNYSTDKHWFIYNVYIEKNRMFSTQIFFKNWLARFARSQSCIHFLQFPTCRYKSSFNKAIYHGITNINETTQGLIISVKICYWPTKHWEESHVFNAKYENIGSLVLNQLYMFSGR